MRLSRLGSALVASGLIFWSALGEAGAGTFRNVKTATINIGQAGEGGRACGLDQNLIKAALLGPLGETKMEIDRSPNPDIQIYADVATVNLSTGDCVSSLSIKVQVVSPVKLKFSKIKYTLPVNLFDESALVNSTLKDHGGTVAAEVDRIVRKFAQAYDLDTRW